MDSRTPAPQSRKRTVVILAVGMLLLTLFAVLAVGVKRRALFVETDVLCRDVLHDHATAMPEVAAVFAGITALGSRWVIWAEGAAVLLALFGLRKWRAALLWGLSFAGYFAVPLFKLWVDRARPVFAVPLVKETSASFPSGHAVGSAIVFGMLAYLLIRAAPRRWLTIVTFSSSLIALIGFSRVYLGAHWLSDVVAGLAFGLGWVALWVAVAEARSLKR